MEDVQQATVVDGKSGFKMFVIGDRELHAEFNEIGSAIARINRQLGFMEVMGKTQKEIIEKFLDGNVPLKDVTDFNKETSKVIKSMSVFVNGQIKTREEQNLEVPDSMRRFSDYMEIRAKFNEVVVLAMSEVGKKMKKLGYGESFQHYFKK